ncbi:MAG: hypothetical protein WKF70_14695 [Chitinophagaceae bacterium]
MHLLKIKAAFLLMVVFQADTIAQRIKILEGTLSALKTEKAINVEFTYEDMKVGKFDKEADYVAKKKEEYNKKEATRGDAWAQNWQNDRDAKFEPKFNELFEKNSDISAGKQKDATYTLIFKTSFTEPGFNIAITRKNAEINGEAWIVETANKANVIAKIAVEHAQGRTFGGFDFDTGGRIAEAYADAGKALGKFVKSNF